MSQNGIVAQGASMLFGHGLQKPACQTDQGFQSIGFVRLNNPFENLKTNPFGSGGRNIVRRSRLVADGPTQFTTNLVVSGQRGSNSVGDEARTIGVVAAQSPLALLPFFLQSFAKIYDFRIIYTAANGQQQRSVAVGICTTGFQGNAQFVWI